MSLAVTDLMVAVLVMPVGILTLVKGEFPFAPVYCLAWICLDVLFCTASIMHLCTISVDRYLSLRYPMKFGRNKTRRRVILKIVFVWLLSIAMSLPLSLMYSKDFNSVLVNGSCQIPDPLYKLIGSIVSFYIPLGVMILTYTWTVRLLAAKRQNLQTGITHNSNQNNPRRSWRRMLRKNYRRTRSDETDVRSATGEELTGAMTASVVDGQGRPQSGRAALVVSVAAAALATAKQGGAGNGALAGDGGGGDDDDDVDYSADDGGSPRTGHHRHHHHHHHHHHRHSNHHHHGGGGGDDDHHRLVTPSESCRSTPFRHNPSVGSADTEMTSLDTRELWLPDTEPTPSTMSALHQFGAEMLRLSRGLEKVASPESKPPSPDASRTCPDGEDEDATEYDVDDEVDDDDDDDDDIEYDDNEDDLGADGDAPPDEAVVRGESACSGDTVATGTPRCRRAKRQRRRRRRRRSGTLHESMRRRFDGGQGRHHHLHAHRHHVHHLLHVHHSPHHRGTAPPPPRVRSFHEDELCRHRLSSRLVDDAVAAGPDVAGDDGPSAHQPKIVGTLLKPEYQRKPGLDEEICLLPPPPRRRRQRGSGGAGDGDVTCASPAAPATSPTPARPPPPPPPSSSSPHEQTTSTATTQPASDHRPPSPGQGQQRRVDTVAEWSSASNAAKTTALTADQSNHHHHHHHHQQNHHRSGGGGQPLRRAMTQKLIRKRTAAAAAAAAAQASARHSPLLKRHGSTLGLASQQQQQQQQQNPSGRQPVHAQKSNTASRSSVMIRNSYRHGRIIRLEQKATKVLGVVFFTFVFLWTPFFALNLLPSVCPDCGANTNKGLIDLVTWLGYASSMVNPVFYTIFNKVFRQAFKRVLMCKYRGRNKRHSWPPQPPSRKV